MNTNSYGISNEMQNIGKKEGFQIYTPIEKMLCTTCKEGVSEYIEDTSGVWAQDLWTIVKNKLLAFEITEKSYAIKEFFNLNFDSIQKTVRKNPKFIDLNEKVWNLATKISSSNDSTEQALLIYSFEDYRAQLRNFQHTFHIAGGNIFIVKGDNGDEAFVGEKELKKYDMDEIKSMYCVNKVIPLPQMDYHLDLFIRPLDNKRVLIADDDLNIEVFETLKEKLTKLSAQQKNLAKKNQYKSALVKLNSTIETEKHLKKINPLPNTNKIAKILEQNGYEPIRVPARVYELTLFANTEEIIPVHYCNYINANVLKKENGDLIYITNKSNIDDLLGLTPEIIKDLGYSYEQGFVEKISPYVKKEHLYFVEGKENFVAEKMLSEFQGGIHCACSEIPLEENVKND